MSWEPRVTPVAPCGGRREVWRRRARTPRVTALLLVLAGVLSFRGVHAQEHGASIRVSLLTFGPGAASWEHFGHNGLWIRDPDLGINHVFDYGRFSFQQENFAARLVKGDMLYWMEGTEASWVLTAYRRAERWIREQELNLTPSQRVALRDFLLENAREENKYYRYNYYYDNCSTRLRDAIDVVTGGAVRRQTADTETGTTFRFHTGRLTSDNAAVYTGLMLGLGKPVDRPISAWEEMFLPFALADHLAGLTTLDTAGMEVPLVLTDRMLFESARYTVSATPPRWALGYLLVGGLLGGIVYGLGHIAHRNRWGRIGYLALSVTLLAVFGIAGGWLLGLWVATDHITSYWNQNLLVFSPLALPLTVLLPLAISGKAWAVRPAHWMVAIMGVTLGLSLLLFLTPARQGNGQLIAFATPLLVAWGLSARAMLKT